MSHRKKDTDYLAISARIRAMENKLLTRERMDRMIEARDGAEAMKLLAECGYNDAAGLDGALAQARAEVFKDMEQGAPDPRLVEVFQIKYDYHNAKTLIKAQAMGSDPERLLLAGGRYDPAQLWDGWKREALSGTSEEFRRAMEQAKAALSEGGDPQRADLILDRACYGEMAGLAKELESPFLQGYVRLSVDVANLRAAVRVARMGREGDFLRQVLLPGGPPAGWPRPPTGGHTPAGRGFSARQPGGPSRRSRPGPGSGRPAGGRPPPSGPLRPAPWPSGRSRRRR